MLVNSINIKMKARELGADLCGIASAESFADAPEGCRPQDIYGSCISVIVFAKRMTPQAMFAENCVPYTKQCDIITRIVDDIGFQLCEALELMGIKAVAVPSDDPYEYWEQEKQYGRGILSMRHAGYLAGLGAIGRNTLLTNMKLGNIIQIGAVLTDAELEPDKKAEYRLCPDGCRRCIDACPANALDGITVNQKLCRPFSCHTNARGFILKGCNECRKVCPYYAGIRAGV